MYASLIDEHVSSVNLQARTQNLAGWYKIENEWPAFLILKN